MPWAQVYNWGQKVYHTWLVPYWGVVEECYHTFHSMVFDLWLDLDPRKL